MADSESRPGRVPTETPLAVLAGSRQFIPRRCSRTVLARLADGGAIPECHCRHPQRASRLRDRPIHVWASDGAGKRSRHGFVCRHLVLCPQCAGGNGLDILLHFCRCVFLVCNRAEQEWTNMVGVILSITRNGDACEGSSSDGHGGASPLRVVAFDRAFKQTSGERRNACGNNRSALTISHPEATDS